MIINKGFQPKRDSSRRLPPGQYETKGFPVLSKGYTPDISLQNWQIKVHGLVDNPVRWSWDEFMSLPQIEQTTDIHCVTKWSKFDTRWGGVALDEIIKRAGLKSTASHLLIYTYDNYSTNLPLADVIDGKALIATSYEGAPISPEHGGPARMFVPHLYFWKSAKWINEIKFIDHDELGFWELRGYHRYGDPWKEQRYDFDE